MTDTAPLLERLLGYAPESGGTIHFGEHSSRRMNEDIRAAAALIRQLEAEKSRIQADYTEARDAHDQKALALSDAINLSNRRHGLLIAATARIAVLEDLLDRAEDGFKAIYNGADGPLIRRGRGGDPVRCARKWEAGIFLRRLIRARCQALQGVSDIEEGE